MNQPQVDAHKDAETYLQAAELNTDDPLRCGSLLEFPDYGQLVMTGDLHGHNRNLERLQSYCDLEHYAARHIILHEMIHADVGFGDRTDMSHLTLLEAARWKCACPDQVHFIQSNHELAQMCGREISKGGRMVTLDFIRGVYASYGQADGDRVMEGIIRFLESFPLAGRTSNRVFLSHSLPGTRDIGRFDFSVFDRQPTPADIAEGGSVYNLVWGRRQTHDVIEAFAETMEVEVIICGHQPQEEGYEVVGDRMLILASDHNFGVFLPFDLSKPQTVGSLVKLIRPLAAVE